MGGRAIAQSPILFTTIIINRLIKWGYGKEEDILKLPLHTAIKRYEWFKKDYEDDMKRQIELVKQGAIRCPFLGKGKK